jgi:uncharacterized protein YbjT (DUF2867 family)
MEKRTAIVFGATGLIGRSLIDELSIYDTYDLIKVFVRKKTDLSEVGKIREYSIDFSNLNEYSEMITGDDLYICLGTTLKKAGSVSKMEEIDRDLPVSISKIASANRVKRVAVVSSIGADSDSSNNYLRMKGEMESQILALTFKTIAILRPSILLGKRKEKRIGESIGKVFIRLFGVFLAGKFRKYRGIEGKDVAKAMIRILNEKTGKEIFESDILERFSNK